MLVTVKLYAGLSRHLAESQPGLSAGAPLEVELPDGATVADLIAELGLPEDEIKVTFVNNRTCPRDRQLESGDEVGIFPPVGGG
jgi:sulfur-carrier protein